MLIPFPEYEIIPQIKIAVQFAQKAHKDQLRAIGPDTGKPYFDTHIVRVVNAVPLWARPAAALHDVLEDTPEAIPTSIHVQYRKAVTTLTRTDDETYFEYISRIVQEVGFEGRVARAVKLADLMDNLSTLPESSLRKRYIRAISQVSKAMIPEVEV